MIFYGTIQVLSPWSDSKLMVDGVKEMNRTKIQYLTHSWSPIAMKCTPISEGCANCWHLAMAKRLAKNPIIDPFLQGAYAGLRPPILNEKELEAPLHLKKPARIGVQFMGDLFHESVNPEFVKEIFHVMHKSFAGDTFFVLTKRPKRMASWFNWIGRNWSPWPIPNLWLGVSVSGPEDLWMVGILLQIPAAYRWVSVEPMLGPVDFNKLPGMGPCSSECSDFGECRESRKWICHQKHRHESHRIDFVVLGGETGPHARPLHPDRVRSVVQQCRSAGVPVFVKQLSGKDAKDMDKWPEDLRIREIPDA